jgi:rhomboid family GlyGly-CTERM serine protease
MIAAMQHERLKRLLPLAVVATTAILLQGLGPSASTTLRFERAAIAHGELWRLLTGHFVHLGWTHLLLNLLGLGFVWSLVGHSLKPWCWGGAIVVCALGVSAGLWYRDPALSWYVGLSGVLHGLLVCGALQRISEHRGSMALLLAAVGIKLVFEQQGIGGIAELDIGGRTIPNAHAYGALTGLLLGVYYQRPALAALARRRGP